MYNFVILPLDRMNDTFQSIVMVCYGCDFIYLIQLVSNHLLLHHVDVLFYVIFVILYITFLSLLRFILTRFFFFWLVYIE